MVSEKVGIPTIGHPLVFHDQEETMTPTESVREPSATRLRDLTGDPLPDVLRSPQSKLVYLYLQSSGGGTVADLRDDLGIKTINLFPVLRRLEEMDVVSRNGERYACCDEAN